jgi:hypothetical protein
MQQEVGVSGWGAPGWGYIGWGGYGWGGWDVYTWTQGTLIVDFTDPRTNQVVWRGTASAVVNHPENPSPKKVEKAVNKLMAHYPVTRM